MPTKKPRVQTILDEKTYQKFKTLCELNRRSESQLANIIITDYIKNLERVNGEIHLEKE